MTSKTIISVKAKGLLSKEEHHRLQAYFSKCAYEFGCKVIVSDDSMDVEVHQPLSELVDAIREQTSAIQQLADSNAALIGAMAMAEEEGEAEGRGGATYLDEREEDCLD